MTTRGKDMCTYESVADVHVTVEGIFPSSAYSRKSETGSRQSGSAATLQRRTRA
jgi:hypothetical protein